MKWRFEEKQREEKGSEDNNSNSNAFESTGSELIYISRARRCIHHSSSMQWNEEDVINKTTTITMTSNTTNNNINSNCIQHNEIISCASLHGSKLKTRKNHKKKKRSKKLEAVKMVTKGREEEWREKGILVHTIHNWTKKENRKSGAADQMHFCLLYKTI